MTKPSNSVLKNASSIFESMRTAGVKPNPDMKASMPYIPPTSPKVPDVSKVVVPHNLVESIVNSMGIKAAKQVIIEEVEQPEVLAESKLNGIVTRLTTLIKEAKTVLEEICSTGAIGVSQKKPLKKTNGPTKTIKRN